MAAEATDQWRSKGESAVKRFSGDADDPQKEWRRWKRWARAYLVVQRARGVPGGAFDSTSIDVLEQPGRQDIIFNVLDDRYPAEAAHDRLGEVLDTIFNLKVEKPGARPPAGKVRAAFAAAEAEGVSFPSVACF